MKEIKPFDEAELKFEFRRMYKDIGFEETVQVLYELVKSAEILSEIMVEERQNEKG